MNFIFDELKMAGNSCRPLIDILSDGEIISCYPLNNFFKIRFHDQLIAKELIDKMDETLHGYREAGIYAHCSICPLFRNRCNGGCMSVRINRFSNSQ